MPLKSTYCTWSAFDLSGSVIIDSMTQTHPNAVKVLHKAALIDVRKHPALTLYRAEKAGLVLCTFVYSGTTPHPKLILNLLT